MLLILAIIVFVITLAYALMVAWGKGMATTPQELSFDGHRPTLVGLIVAGVLLAGWWFGW